MKHFKPLYKFITNELNTEWIDLGPDNRTDLPEDYKEANRTANVILPCNWSTLQETSDKLRNYYKFDKIPEEWIYQEYAPKELLPNINNTILKLAEKTKQTIIILIVDETQTRRTVAILHKYFNFHRLPKEFFRIQRFQEEVVPKYAFNDDPFVL